MLWKMNKIRNYSSNLLNFCFLMWHFCVWFTSLGFNLFFFSRFLMSQNKSHGIARVLYYVSILNNNSCVRKKKRLCFDRGRKRKPIRIICDNMVNAGCNSNSFILYAYIRIYFINMPVLLLRLWELITRWYAIIHHTNMKLYIAWKREKTLFKLPSKPHHSFVSPLTRRWFW